MKGCSLVQLKWRYKTIRNLKDYVYFRYKYKETINGFPELVELVSIRFLSKKLQQMVVGWRQNMSKGSFICSKNTKQF